MSICHFYRFSHSSYCYIFSRKKKVNAASAINVEHWLNIIIFLSQPRAGTLGEFVLGNHSNSDDQQRWP